MEQVLTLSGRTGTLGRFDGKDSDVPFFEKFFLGGPYNLRGWDYREAGPQISNEPSGGNSYSYLSAEYRSKWRIRCALLFSTTVAFCGRAISNLFQETDCRDGMTIGVLVCESW